MMPKFAHLRLYTGLKPTQHMPNFDTPSTHPRYPLQTSDTLVETLPKRAAKHEKISINEKKHAKEAFLYRPNTIETLNKSITVQMIYHHI